MGLKKSLLSSFTLATNTIQYITIPTTGNAQDFGDLASTNSNASSGLSNSTRGIIGDRKSVV